MKKILLVATVQSHIAQFHKPLIRMLHENDCEVYVAARDNLAEKNGLKLDCVEGIFNVPFARSPFSLKNIKAYKQLKKIIKDGNYDIVHCNTPVGGILTRMACSKLGKHRPFVIYEAHGFHFYKGSPKKSWLLWYPIEKHFAKRTDLLITICREDFELASKKFKCKTVWVHGVGINTEKYIPLADDKKKEIRDELSIAASEKVILCTGELNENKNQIALINSLPYVLKNIPNVIVLLAGNGPQRDKLEEAAQNLGLKNNVIFLGYRTDLERYVNIADLVVSCSYREGFGMNIAEAMWLSKPVVVSKNRGHNELVENGINGLVVSPLTSELLSDCIVKILSDPTLAREFGIKGKEKSDLYTDKNIEKELNSVYFGGQ